MEDKFQQDQVAKKEAWRRQTIQDAKPHKKFVLLRMLGEISRRTQDSLYRRR